jgi:NADPH:quinone reductase
MKAAWYTRNGAASEVLEIGDTPDPQPGLGEVRVRIWSSGVNPSDTKSRQTRAFTFPRIIPHNDGAGVIEALGSGVPASRLGERVWLWNTQWGGDAGTAAEYVCVPSEKAVTLPDNISFDEGACFGVPALTALQAVRLLGNIEDQAVLVTGGGGSVGFYATQFARLAGARVIATSSATRADHARAAGADAVIDYRSESVTDAVKAANEGYGVDAIVDMDFSSTAPLLSEGILKSHGRMTCYGSNNQGAVAVPFAMLPFYSVTIRFMGIYVMKPEEKTGLIKDFLRILQMYELKHKVGARYALGDIALAHEAVEAGKTIGNIVVAVGPED